MSRRSDYQFVDTDSSALESRLIGAYEAITGRTLNPADPDRVFVAWVLSVIVQERAQQNYVGNQNIPSRAEGANLDALGEWIFNIKRLSAQPSKCTMKFEISTAQPNALIIPRGTRVTDSGKTLVWSTTDDAEIKIGETSVCQTVKCESVGTIGNGFVAGQINRLIDVDSIPYLLFCCNIETSNGGSEEANDEEYYELMRAGLDAYSTAGPRGAYEYHAKSVSTAIADVAVVIPEAGHVDIYALMKDGTAADSVIKSEILSTCNDDSVRPLTDYVQCKDADAVSYDIELTYFIKRGTDKPIAEIQRAVMQAVDEYVEWQRGKIGRDINPSKLDWLLRDTGIKRAVITSPTFTKLNSGEARTTPQFASVEKITVTNGGFEYE